MILVPKADVKNLGNPCGARMGMKTGKDFKPDCSESSPESDDCSERLSERRDKLTFRMEYLEFQSSNTR
jgi:hypothetical protein